MGIKVHFRNGYSDRKGLTKFNEVAQFQDLNARTRNILYDFLTNSLNRINQYSGNAKFKGETLNGYKDFYRYLWIDVFAQDLDTLPISRGQYTGLNEYTLFNHVKAICIGETYEIVFTLLEAIEDYTIRNRNPVHIQDTVNTIFTTEQVEHRFVDGRITDVINPEEIEEIEDAIGQNNTPAEHISKALALLYDHNSPDFENSVKESISGVEAMCNIVLGNGSKATLGQALKQLEDKGVSIHGALKAAFNQLYGYTSDKDGMRHAYGIDTNTTYEEAKYMLVSCSAFINYLRSLS